MSQQDSETTTIAGVQYRVRYIDPLTATDITIDLAKMFGPVLAAIGGNLMSSSDTKGKIKSLLDGDSSDENAMIGESIERALVGLFNNMSKEQVRFLIDTMSEVTEVKQGDSWPQLDQIFTIHFRGRPADIFKWLAFAMKVNFKGFFSGMGGAIAHAAQRMGLAQ